MPDANQANRLRLEYVPVAALAPNPWNSNIVSPENEQKLIASFKRLGSFKPITVRTLPGGQLQILGGEHRWLTAKKLGMTEVAIVNLGVIDDQKATEISLVDNGRYGEDDPLQLAAVYKTLGSIEELATFLPYTDDTLNEIFAASSIALEQLEIDEKEAQAPNLEDLDRPPPTHQIMRFKVPVGDCQMVETLIERIMKLEGFTKDDSLSNAGNALVSMCQKLKDEL